MTFLRHGDDIINLERITRIYKNEVLCEAIPSGIVRLHEVVLTGDGQEINIRCDSEKEANETLNSIQEILKKCSRYYFF